MSATIRSTVPCPPPESEKPTQLVSQYRVTGLDASNRLLWRNETAISPRLPGYPVMRNSLS
jgi:hypothetical protein